MSINTQVLIIGGSINGSTLAIILAQNGINVTLVETKKITFKKLNSFDGRAYALALSTYKMLNSLGLWTELEKNSEPILDIKVGTSKDKILNSNALIHFNHLDMDENENPMGYILEDRYFRKQLFSQLKKHKNINVIDEVSIADHKINGVTVISSLSNGQKIKSNLLIGCDGQNSKTVDFAKINKIGWSYDQSSLVCAINHTKPHESCAYQLFQPAGPIAILPLPNNRSSIVWTEKTKTANYVNQLNKKDYENILRSRLNVDLGEISLDGKKFLYPLNLSLSENFISNRVALVGDSAHGIHPLAGQGLNLGMRDIASIGEIIITAYRRGEDLGSLPVLKRYENWRRFETSLIAATTDIINKSFSNHSNAIKAFASLGLKAVNQNNFLKKNFIREAAGINGNLPRLLQGKSI